MSPYAAGGRWVPAPGVSYGPPGRNGVPMPLPDKSTSSAVAGFRGDAEPVWGTNPLDGPRVVRVGGAAFRIPRSAQAKRSARASTVWVLFEGATYVFSELGCLVQSDAERRSVPWELL